MNLSNLLIELGMWTFYALIGVALLAFVYFAVRQMIDDPKRAKTTLIGIAGTLVIFAIAMLLSSGTDISDLVLEKADISHGGSRWIGAGLITTYFCFGGAIISLITIEIMRPFKK